MFFEQNEFSPYLGILLLTLSLTLSFFIFSLPSRTFIEYQIRKKREEDRLNRKDSFKKNHPEIYEKNNNNNTLNNNSTGNNNDSNKKINKSDKDNELARKQKIANLKEEATIILQQVDSQPSEENIKENVAQLTNRFRRSVSFDHHQQQQQQQHLNNSSSNNTSKKGDNSNGLNNSSNNKSKQALLQAEKEHLEQHLKEFE